MDKESATHGVDLEASSQPLTKEIINQAREAAGIAMSLLLSPVGMNGRSGDKAFYANAIMHFRVEYTNKIPTAGVSVTDKVNLYVNPYFFLSLTVNKRIELYIHEIEHVMNMHMIKAKELKDDSGLSHGSTHKLYNIATDANINIHLTDLTEDLGVTIERLNEQLAKSGSKQVLDKKDSSEVHFWKLRQFQEEMGPMSSEFGEGSEGSLDDHTTWDESYESKEVVEAVVKDALNKAAEVTGIGNCPSSVVKTLQELNKSLVNWKRQLQQFTVRTMKFNRERTRTKRNRRTGIINPGSRKQPKVRIALIGDESGSMSDSSVAQFFCEMDKIASLGVEVLYIPMDANAGEVIAYKKGMKMERTRSGGTVYSSGINKAKELKVDGIIIAGDMDASDTPKDPKIPVLWAVFGNSEPPAKFGKKITVTEDR
jgi:predicted metal-dependent peptidase